MRVARRLMVLTLCGALVHCGDDGDEPVAPADASGDSSSTEVSTDTDVATDAPGDLGADSIGDAGPDAEGDTPRDVGGDAATDADAVPSGLDPTFGSGGKVLTALRDGSDTLVDVARQPDGKLVAIGSNLAHGALFVVRLDVDGKHDASFGSGGRVLVPVGVDGRAIALALQPDGKILALARGGSNAVLVRLDATGALDATFGTAGSISFAESPFALAVQPDGKALVALGPTSTLGPAVVARLNVTDGSLDTTFGTSGRASAWGATDSPEPFAIEVDGAGRVVVVAELTGGLGIARFTSAGVADATFGSGGIVSTQLARDTTLGHPLVVQADGRIVTGGRRLGTASERALARYDEAGALDVTFDGDGYASTGNEGALEDLALDGTGAAATIVALRGASVSGDAVYRFTLAGARDTTFGVSGRAAFEAGNHALVAFGAGGLALAGEVKVAGGGGYPVFRPRVLRSKSDGALDASWATAGSARVHTTASLDEVRALTLASDGSVLAAGGSSFEGATGWGWALAKYDITGALDPAFGAAGLAFVDDTSTQARARAIAIDPSGRVVVAGGRDFATARFTASGARDTSFGTNGTATLLGASGYAYAYAMTLDATGRPLVAGTRSTGAGRASVIVRATASGVTDSTFGTDGLAASANTAGVNAYLAVALQSDGKILATGTGKLTRYDANGAHDPSFGDTAGAMIGRAISVTSDGKILVAGSAGTIVSVSDLERYVPSGGQLIVRRHLPTGPLDVSFAAGGTLTTDLAGHGLASPVAFAVRALPDGRAYVAGSCVQAGINRGFVLRLLASGALDATFGAAGVLLAPDTASTSGLFALALQTDGRAIAGGFAHVDPSGRDFALVRFSP